MINIREIENFTSRTWGWIQDAGDLSKLTDVVAIFDCRSEVNRSVKKRIEELVLSEHGKERFLHHLEQEIINIPYIDLYGKNIEIPDSSPKDFYCTGIIQATIQGQKRAYIRSWPADNYVRFALTLGLIEYDYESDSCFLSNLGKELIELRHFREEAASLYEQEKDFFIDLLMAYPPAIRILELLSLNESRHLSKFEISENMAFVGEAGFVTYPVDILLESIAQEKDPKEKNKMRTDWESTLDKYARMISGWLESVGLLRRVEKKFNIYDEVVTLGQSYKLTGKGYQSLRKSQGMSSHAIIPKRISWEMLATKEDKERVRTRRALILKRLTEPIRNYSYVEIAQYINENDFISLDVTENEVKDDLIGLKRMGLMIDFNEETVRFKDELIPFTIPVKIDANYEASNLEKIKSFLRDELTNISHDWLQLVDLSYDNRSHRIFEMQTISFFKNILKYQGEHLGGASKPDGAIWEENYGMILDTKAYKNGFSINTKMRRQMEDYIQDIIHQDVNRQSNEWWKVFPEEMNDFSFLFISSFFTGKYEDVMRTIEYNTNISGGAVTDVQLLLIGDKFASKEIEYNQVRNLFTNHDFINETKHILEYKINSD